MRDHSNHIEVSREEAVRLLLESCSFTPAVETIPIDQAYGRMLAHDATAQLDMPNCLTCRMDSVAVHWDDFADGMPDTSAWKRGDQWEFANTGIGMPEGFDTAIVIEHVQLSDDLSQISFDAAPSSRNAGTSPAGSRMHSGDVLVAAGAQLTPLLLSHIASGNNTTVDVLARPRVAFLPTGNELVNPGDDVPRGKNIETNSILVRGKVEAWGGTASVHAIVPDDPDAIKAAVAEACHDADIVVLNAGSSKGSDDWNVEMLQEIGTVLYHQTNHGPGHHSSAAVVDGTPVVGISGPPGGAAFTTDFYVKPLVDSFLGRSTEPVMVTARLAVPFPAGGPGAHKGAGGGKGEDRPSVVKPSGSFFGIKQLHLSIGADGMLEATPLGGSHPGAVEADTADAYYAQPAAQRDAPLQAGDAIEVEVRPRQL